MIKKLNFICVMAIALSGTCVRATDAPASNNGAGWGQRVKDAAKLLGVVAAIGLAVVAYKKMKPRSGGNQLGNRQPEPLAVIPIRDVLGQVSSEQVDQQAIKQWVLTTLAERDRALQQKFTTTTDRLQSEVDDKVCVAEFDKDKNTFATKSAVSASSALFDERFANIERNMTTQAGVLEAVSGTQNHDKEDRVRLDAAVSGVSAAMKKMESELPGLIEKHCAIKMANRSLERYKQQEAAQGAVSPKASRVKFRDEEEDDSGSAVQITISPAEPAPALTTA